MGRSKDLKDKNNYVFGKLVAATYEQLVATAKRRLFGLKEHLEERYDSMDVNNLMKRALEDSQITIEYINKSMEN